MDFVSALGTTQEIVILLLGAAAGLAGVLSLVHAALTRPDAFTAVDRQTKGFWVGILALSTLFLVVFGVAGGVSAIIGMICLLGLVAVLVYLVDVRPKVDEVSGRRWFRKL
ncbi:MAG TPA: DUF2516 family protein [Gordonia sp. (in: high G+C Gram-positive bacteria)]|uniref:DUF2516 family protein n=1 Tax=unclassified Gordonia (in: high G+C Gram-positive bacteria) TaxID=2657482 RepID=UPI000FB9A0D8|nr:MULTISPECIES: DUF2516 family protein [unclassified Gordonia (in: high G+C Gram-positive bacteria)]RUP39985.1 MAG: DUF2516 family protein [Gordonia sp. (in: high G+C Gram-positive bacteria)]HNP56551.1 DUF2516 family protein [Gordonia sp. (in: high G+C Gram-positive bacteria)]HRC49640.1 DUF2516 family protein [Gordonia sp. (in: high G+C Gram-positive bacteria)]